MASYTVGLAATGNLHQWNIGGALKATLWGGISGAVTFGIGSIFNAAATGVLTTTGHAIKEAIGGFGLAMVQAGTHAVAQGVMSLMQGGSFEQAFWSGALGSLGASAFGAVAGKAASSTVGTIAFGAISGGIGAELSGGNFWQGAVIGGIVAGLNHAMHRDESSSPPPPEEDEWHTKIINALSGGAVDDARAILAFEATNPSTMDRIMFHMGLNARDVKSEFMGYGLGVRGRGFTRNIAPKGWKQQVSKKGGGIVFKDPKNPHNIIRQMPGNLKSPNIAQRKPYVKFMKNGRFYDVNGNVLKSGALPEAHIPLNKFNINKMPK